MRDASFHNCLSGSKKLSWQEQTSKETLDLLAFNPLVPSKKPWSSSLMDNENLIEEIHSWIQCLVWKLLHIILIDLNTKLYSKYSSNSSPWQIDKCFRFTVYYPLSSHFHFSTKKYLNWLHVNLVCLMIVLALQRLLMIVLGQKSFRTWYYQYHGIGNIFLA